MGWWRINHVLVWGRAGRLVGEASGNAREIAWGALEGLDFFRLLGRLGFIWIAWSLGLLLLGFLE